MSYGGRNAIRCGITRSRRRRPRSSICGGISGVLRHLFFFVSSFLHSTNVESTKRPFPRPYGSSSGHRQVVASSAPLIYGGP